MEEIVRVVVFLVPQINNRIAKVLLHPMPQIMKEILNVLPRLLPQIKKETTDGVQLSSQELLVEVFKVLPQVRDSERIVGSGFLGAADRGENTKACSSC